MNVQNFKYISGSRHTSYVMESKKKNWTLFLFCLDMTNRAETLFDIWIVQRNTGWDFILEKSWMDREKYGNKISTKKYLSRHIFFITPILSKNTSMVVEWAGGLQPIYPIEKFKLYINSVERVRSTATASLCTWPLREISYIFQILEYRSSDPRDTIRFGRSGNISSCVTFHLGILFFKVLVVFKIIWLLAAFNYILRRYERLKRCEGVTFQRPYGHH